MYVYVYISDIYTCVCVVLNVCVCVCVWWVHYILYYHEFDFQIIIKGFKYDVHEMCI